MGLCTKGIRLNGKRLQVGLTIDGKWCRYQTTLCDTKEGWTKAIALRNQMILDKQYGQFDLRKYPLAVPPEKEVNAGGMSFAEVGARYIGSLYALTPSTVKSYRSALSKWNKFIGAKPIGMVLYSDLTTALGKIKVSKKTISNYLIVLKGTFGLAIADKLISYDPSGLVKSQKGQDPKPDPLMLPEVDRILEHMRENYPEQVMNYFDFAFHVGMRPNELIALRWSDFDKSKREIRVERGWVEGAETDGKTHQARDVHLTPRALSVLSRQMEHTKDLQGHIFYNPETGKPWAGTAYQLKNYWHPCLLALNIRKRKAYATRATFATALLQRGAGLDYVAKQLGHSNILTLLRHYKAYLPDAQAVDKAKADAIFGIGVVGIVANVA